MKIRRQEPRGILSARFLNRGPVSLITYAICGTKRIEESKFMKITDTVIFPKRNIYSHRPVIKMIVDIEKDTIPTKDIPGFNEKLLEAFPGLKQHVCGLGYEGGFLERLITGTYLAHVLEHVTLELQHILGYQVKYGKTRVIEEPSIYYLVYEYENEVIGMECGKAAAFILNGFIHQKTVDIGSFLDYLKKVAIDTNLGPSTSAIAREAKKRDIPVTRIDHDSLIQLNYGKLSRSVESTLTDVTSCISVDISCNKQLTKSILKDNKIPTPYGKVVYSLVSALMVANQIGTPVVVKPFDGNQGKGVHLNLSTEEEITAAFYDAVKYSKGIIVEKYIAGRDYRVLVVGNEVKAVAERLPASVTGDGRHSVRELIELVNQNENRGDDHEKALTKIKLDESAEEVLRKEGLAADSVPPDGETVTLRENANLSTGGTAVDRTDGIHPDNAAIAVRAANAIGVDIAGIDIVTEDISKSIYETNGVVIEVNAAPGIRMHLYPSQGTPRNVAKDIVDWLYPPEQPSNFPIVSVTGTNGKTTVTRLIAHILAGTGWNVGYTSTSGTFVNEQCICPGDNSGPVSAKTLLSNKTIDAAVLETARGGIVRKGLGYDLADVGVITNISEDHLGLDGIETLEDLAFVKALVVEAIKKDGYAVLNAEDSMTGYLLGRVKAKKILFYQDERKAARFQEVPAVRVYTDHGLIKIEDGMKTFTLCPVAAVPITCNGMIACNIENSLAAAAAAYGMKVPAKKIAEGLKSFQCNAGRFNLYAVQNYSVLLDYAHNQSGYEAVVNACRRFQHKRLVGIIGMPGDRLDKAMRQVGRFCAEAFDKIYIKEDVDLRNRRRGEVARILQTAIEESGFDPRNLLVFDNERNALRHAMENAEEDDLVVVLYEKMEPLKEMIEEAMKKTAVRLS